MKFFNFLNLRVFVSLWLESLLPPGPKTQRLHKVYELIWLMPIFKILHHFFHKI
jgi:hypothetical protein